MPPFIGQLVKLQKFRFCFGRREVNSSLFQPLSNILFSAGVIGHLVYCNRMLPSIVLNYYTLLLQVINKSVYRPISKYMDRHFFVIVTSRFRLELPFAVRHETRIAGAA
jgi:hypothetical protein